MAVSEWVWFPLSVKITINHRSVLLVFTTIDRKRDLVKMKSNREREREREKSIIVGFMETRCLSPTTQLVGRILSQ